MDNSEELFKDLDKDLILKSCFERKKIGFEMIKDWENNHKHNLNILKNLIDTIFQRIENLLEISISRFNGINEIFKGLKIKLNICNLKPIINNFKNISINENSNNNMNNSLLMFEKGINKFQDNISKFNKSINDEIIDNILKKKINSYEKNIKILYSKIDPLKKKIQQNTENLMDIMINLNKLFKENIKKIEKDFLINSLDFYLLLKSIINFIIDLSNIMIEIWKQSIILEENRNELVKNSFYYFFNWCGTTFGNFTENLFDESKDYFHNSNYNEWSQKFFDINKLLIEEEIKLINKKLKKEGNLSFTDINKYFSSFSLKFENINLTYLIWSKWQCKLNNKDNVILFLSIDFNFSSFIISI